MATGRLALNLTAFERARFVNPDGTLTREAQQALQIVQRRIGGEAGLIYAETITTVPAGGLSAADVQAALNELDFEKQTKDATLTALAALSSAADRLIYATGADTFALATLTAFARTLLDDIDAAAMRATLGLVIDTDVQAYDADLAAWAGKTAPTGDTVGTTDAQTLSAKTLTAPVVNNPTGTMTLASGVLGYAAGNGGAVAQLTSKSTGVTLNKISGEVTMNNASLAAGAAVTFTLTNSTAAATDVVVVNHASGGTAGAYALTPQASAGSVSITVRNLTAGPLSEAIVLRFAIIKAATA